MSYVLTEAQWEQFVRDMENPGPADPQWTEVAKAMEAYRQRVKLQRAQTPPPAPDAGCDSPGGIIFGMCKCAECMSRLSGNSK